MEKVFKCNLCNEEMNSLNKLNVHIELQHDTVRESKHKQFKCNVCGYQCSMKKNLIDHMRVHTGERPFKCKVVGCGMEFKQDSHLNDHAKYKHSEHRPLICDFPHCGHTAKTSNNLTKHMRVHSNDKPFACSISSCSFRAKSKYEITRHIKFVHSNAKPFACSNCDYRATLISHVKLHHMRRHSATTCFKCSHPQCTASFKTLTYLQNHYSNRHGERNIQCDHLGCGRKFANPGALKRHIRTVHSKKIHVCPVPSCNCRTNLQICLARHMTVHKEKKDKISCSIEGCQHKAKNSNALNSHIRRHKTSLPCPVSGCGRFVTNKEALKNHMKLHNPSGRPFQCPLCLKHFQTLPVMKEHCAFHTNEKPFHCGHCEHSTTLQSSIREHITLVHSNIRFPSIVLPLGNRQCVRCKVTLPLAEFIIHSMGHSVPVVVIKRMVAKFS